LDPDFIRDLFAQFGPVTVKRMFSGAGIFYDGLMFGLVVRGAIYLKADEASSADFAREGSGPFAYTRGKSKGRPSRRVLPYWRLPERLYDDPDELAAWARRAFDVAQAKMMAPRRRSKRRLTKSSAGRRRSRA
jgi:DNA transformation protein